MEDQQLRQLILRELPDILQRDPQVQELVLRLARQHFAGKTETESRFDRLLDELRRDREEQSRKWDEQTHKWDGQTDRWEEQARRWKRTSRHFGK